MFALTAAQRFFLYGQAVDMRKSFDALSGIVTTGMGKDVLSGDVFIFIGKSRDKIKLLVWELLMDALCGTWPPNTASDGGQGHAFG